MAQGQLPLYYNKNSKLVGPTSTKSRTKWSEYYLLVVTLFGFLMLFAGILWFLPSIDEDDGYTKAYDGFTGTESTAGTSLAGTESVMSPVPDQRIISPTFHSNVSNVSWNGNHSMVQANRKTPSLGTEPDQRKSPSSASANPVISHKPSESVSPHDLSVKEKLNTKRRNKIVEVGSTTMQSVPLIQVAIGCYWWP